MASDAANTPRPTDAVPVARHHATPPAPSTPTTRSNADVPATEDNSTCNAKAEARAAESPARNPLAGTQSPARNENVVRANTHIQGKANTPKITNQSAKSA